MTKKISRTAIAIMVSLAVIMTYGFIPTTASAASTTSKPKIEEVEYESKGRVDVEFYGKVDYKNVKVKAKDASGKSYTARVAAKDNDELDFIISGYKTNTKYSFTISGIKKRSESEYTSVSGSVKIPSVKKVTVEEVDYDYEDKELTVEFKNIVQWNSPKVTVTDLNGKAFTARITERDSDEIEAKVKGLKVGKTYKYKITGIKAKGADNYTSVSGSFKVRYDD